MEKSIARIQKKYWIEAKSNIDSRAFNARPLEMSFIRKTSNLPFGKNNELDNSCLFALFLFVAMK